MSKLTELDILDLLDEYKSELRKLKFKFDHVQERIKELEMTLKELKQVSKIQDKELKIEKVKISEAHDDGRRKPYPLSDWDKAIIGSIQEAGKALISKEILNTITEVAKAEGFFKDDQHTKIKLNQCLVKLANRRNDIVKLHFHGRGFMYAMPDWVEGRALKKEYER